MWDPDCSLVLTQFRGGPESHWSRSVSPRPPLSVRFWSPRLAWRWRLWASSILPTDPPFAVSGPPLRCLHGFLTISSALLCKWNLVLAQYGSPLGRLCFPQLHGRDVGAQKVSYPVSPLFHPSCCVQPHPTVSISSMSLWRFSGDSTMRVPSPGHLELPGPLGVHVH